MSRMDSLHTPNIIQKSGLKMTVAEAHLSLFEPGKAGKHAGTTFLAIGGGGKRAMRLKWRSTINLGVIVRLTTTEGREPLRLWELDVALDVATGGGRMPTFVFDREQDAAEFGFPPLAIRPRGRPGTRLDPYVIIGDEIELEFRQPTIEFLTA